MAKGIHDTAEELLADRNLEKAPGGLHLISFRDPGVITQHNGSDLRLFEIQGEAINSTRKLQHLIKHDAAEPFDTGNTVTDFTDGPDI